MQQYKSEEERLKSQWKKIWENQSLQEDIKSCEEDTNFLNKLREYLPLKGRILEGGAGLGRWVWYLTQKNYDITGVEIVEDCVRQAKDKYPGLKMVQGNILKLDFPDSSFDCYISTNVFEHFINGPDEAIKEMRRILKPGGIAIISVPFINTVRNFLYPARSSLRIFKRMSLLRKLLKKEPLKYDAGEEKKNYLAQKALMKDRGLYPIFEHDPEKGRIFCEYKFRAKTLEKYLLQNKFKIIDSSFDGFDYGFYVQSGETVLYSIFPGHAKAVSKAVKSISRRLDKRFY